MASLDFRKQKKTYLEITFDDDAQTHLSLMQPTKQLFELMVSMSSSVGDMENMNDSTSLSEVYEVCAQLMSRNKQGIDMTRARLEGMLDFEDIVAFLQSYSSFVARVITLKS